MTKTMLAAAATAALVIGLAGCGGDEGDDPEAGESSSSTPEAPETVTVSVGLHDHGTQEALFNADDRTCTSRNLAEAFDIAIENPDVKADELRELMPKTTVTLKDAAGTTIGLLELPEDGGTFKKSTGCDWTVAFEDIEPSDFYEVVVEHGDFSTTEQGEGGDGDVVLDVTF